MKIEISWQSALLIFMAVLVLIMSMYFYRGYQMQSMSNTITQTQQILSQLTLSPQIAQAFRSIGFTVVGVRPQALPQPETLPQSEVDK